MQEFEAILERLVVFSPYHRDQDKSTRQLWWERWATRIAIGIAVSLGVMCVMLAWKTCGLPTTRTFGWTGFIVGSLSQILSLPWLLCQIRAQWIERWEQKRGLTRAPRSDIYRRKAEQDARHARELVGYSEVALVDVRLYLTHRVRGLAGLAKIGRVWGPLISVGGGFLLKHQFDPAVVGQYVINHGIQTASLIGTASAGVAAVCAVGWGIYQLLKRHRNDAYQLSIVELAIAIKRAADEDRRRMPNNRRGVLLT
ncbi:hypothetical protein [Burkholderia sp. NLJ2]|uniref:hypothetical protein n=1 Tax=Burkholderia sp. NLJ2 TaxID=3090699 RepID=UPI003C6C1E85